MRTGERMRLLRCIGLPLMMAGVLICRSAFGELDTDVVTASNMVRQTSNQGTNYFMGKVGIGTNEPAVQLDVVGSLKVSGAMKIPKQGDVTMGSYTNGESVNGITGGSCIWATNAAGDVYVLKNVGIGTNNPSANLEVVGLLKAGSLELMSNLVVNGTITGHGDFDMGSSNTITNLRNPVNDQDATTKKWVSDNYLSTSGDGSGLRYLATDNYTLTYTSDGKLKVNPRLEENISLLVFDQLVRHGISDYGMADGFIDAFKAGSNYLDNSRCANNRWNAATNFFYNAASGGSAGHGTLTNAWNSKDVSYIVADSGVPATQSGVTLSMWFYLYTAPAANDGLILTRSPYYMGMVFGESSTLAAVVGDAGSHSATSGSLSTGIWYHAVAVLDGADKTQLYINAVKYVNDPPHQNTYASITWNIARDPPAGPAGRNPYCKVDEVAIWTNAVSSNAIVSMYNSGAGIRLYSGDAYSSGRVLLWHLDETNGTAVSAEEGPSGTSATGYAWTNGIIEPIPASPGTYAPLVMLSTNWLIDFVPSSIKMDAWVSVTNGTTVNTDLIGKVSRDNGTNWNTATLTKANDFLPATTNTVMYTSITSVTNQPNGSNIVIKIMSTNECEFKVFGMGWTAGE